MGVISMELNIGQFLRKYVLNKEKFLTQKELQELAEDPAIQKVLDDEGKKVLKLISTDEFFPALSHLDNTFDGEDVHILGSYAEPDEDITEESLKKLTNDFASHTAGSLIRDFIHFKYYYNKDILDSQKEITKEELQTLIKSLEGKKTLPEVLQDGYDISINNPERFDWIGAHKFGRIENIQNLKPEVKTKIIEILKSIVTNLAFIDQDRNGNLSTEELKSLEEQDGKYGISIEDIAKQIEQALGKDSRRAPSTP